MNYAFKMMSVVLALGVLVLQGCNNSKLQVSSYWSNYDDKQLLCNQATRGSQENKRWAINSSYLKYVDKAKALGLDCGVKGNTRFVNKSPSSMHSPKHFADVTNNYVCDNSITIDKKYNRIWNTQNYLWIKEAQRRGLGCGVINDSYPIITSKLKNNKQSMSYYEEDNKKN